MFERVFDEEYSMALGGISITANRVNKGTNMHTNIYIYIYIYRLSIFNANTVNRGYAFSVR